MALACVVMYLMAIIHWAMDLHSALAESKHTAMLRQSSMDCLTNMLHKTPCNAESLNDISGIPSPHSCADTALLAVNVGRASCTETSDSVELKRTPTDYS